MTYIRSCVRDPGLAEDIFQETLLTGWSKLDEFDQSRPLAPWLRGIAMNLCRNAWRREARSVLVFSDRMAEMAESTLGKIEQHDGDEWGEKLNVMRTCLDGLTPKSRELIRCRYEDNHNAARIARDTSANPSAIRKRLQRVRLLLAECLERNLVEGAGA